MNIKRLLIAIIIALLIFSYVKLNTSYANNEQKIYVGYSNLSNYIIDFEVEFIDDQKSKTYEKIYEQYSGSSEEEIEEVVEEEKDEETDETEASEETSEEEVDENGSEESSSEEGSEE